MIGVKPKKKKEFIDIDLSLIDGQAKIYGKVTERNIHDNSVTNAVEAQVSVYKNGNLIGLTTTSEDGTYFIESINSDDDYTAKFEKDSVFVTPVFTLASRQAKQINIELTTDAIF
ncbi:hypothetical protein IMCC3317_11040 [Kordia antarctica]|uniref:Uncharacterized protein n=1 Tax=Kordia antarctica TaxID=1218801 RepID=A0A7L4ZHR1_9FLAO|nr:hypothetical protein [Kordia antarctica]QHI35756.1 hypothetical protein IMCC3317_11040 [Kordia antarctica]